MDLAQALGHRVVDLYAEMATEENLVKAIEENYPELCFLFGHGSPDSFAGQNGTIVLKACINDDILQGTRSLFVSCSTGVTLGPSIKSKGALAYLGWQADYFFYVDDSYPILEDPYAKGFMESAITPGLVLLRGGSVASAYRSAIAKYNEWIRYWWQSDDPVAADVITYLVWDRNNLIAIGDGFITAKIPIPVLALPLALAYLAFIA